MPEGPEVRNTTDWLYNKLYNKTIISMKEHTNIKTQWKLIHDILPLKVDTIGCKGKQIYICSTDKVILHHMIMTGSWTADIKRHCQFELQLNDGSSIYYNDTRKMGHFKILDIDNLDNHLSKIGVDVLCHILVERGLMEAPKWYVPLNYSDFYNIIKRNTVQKMRICEFLLEQKYVSGIGNYLRSDILYDAKIFPTLLINELDDDDISGIYNSMIDIIWKSYSLGGYTLSDYMRPDGSNGGYNTLIYNKTNNTFKDKKNRTVYWDPKIQK